MSRATVVYVGMIFVFIAGLWAVLVIGGGLVAPEDLAGRWTAVGGSAGYGGGRWPGLTVQQSGQYFQLAFDDGPAMGVTLADTAGARGGPLVLARGPWRVTIGGPAGRPAGTPPDVRTFHVDGPAAGTFVGRRETPTAATASPATRPARKDAP